MKLIQKGCGYIIAHLKNWSHYGIVRKSTDIYVHNLKPEIQLRTSHMMTL